MSDINDRIAKAKGWIFRPARYPYRPVLWQKPDGNVAISRPDFTGTLEGVAGLLSDLADAPEGMYMLAPQATGWLCAVAGSWTPSYFSPPDHPGDCVGEAWMSVFGKEAADATAK